MINAYLSGKVLVANWVNEIILMKLDVQEVFISREEANQKFSTLNYPKMPEIQSGQSI